MYLAPPFGGKLNTHCSFTQSLATENYSPWATVVRCLYEDIFSRFDTTPDCNGRRHTHRWAKE